MATHRSDALDWLATRVAWECLLDELHARAGRECAASERTGEPSCATAPATCTPVSSSVFRLRSPVRGMSRREAALRIRT
jgi:hypothetical protein